MFDTLVRSLLTIGLLWLVFRLGTIGTREQNFPPGPPTLPFIGNVLVFPKEKVYLKFTQWARQYGGIYSLKIYSSTVVVISNMTIVKALMDTQSGVTANRPSMVIQMGKLVADGLHFTLANADSYAFRVSRKAVQTILTPTSVTRNLPIVHAELYQLLHDMALSPQDFSQHLQRFTFSTMSSIVYGKRYPQCDSPETVALFNYSRLFTKTLSPSNMSLLDSIMTYVAEGWTPRKVVYEDIRRMGQDLYFGMLDESEQRSARGDCPGSFMEDIIQNLQTWGMTRELAGYTGEVLMEGGADTITAFLNTLILCLVAHPECLSKAHEELDRVVGDRRLPSLQDSSNLPYLNALIKEVHRFRPLFPIGIPHQTSEPITFKGQVIPNGATLFINVWGIYHDADIFDRPDDFWPERYLLSEHGTKPGVDCPDFRASIPFGSGRRICPGMFFANTLLPLIVSNLIWAFDFTPSADPNTGEMVPVDITDFYEGLAMTPKPFSCKVTPRTSKKLELVEREFLECSSILSKYL